MNKEIFKHLLLNAPGVRLKEKYLVIQSDDWGSIRMPSNSIRTKLSNIDGVLVDDPYSKYDTLCSSEDIEALFETLSQFKDSDGRHPIITANAVMGNPDFDKMRQDNYSNYHGESLDVTFERFGLSKSLKLWEEGSSNGFFDFQFHGREHVNIIQWLRALNYGPKAVAKAADLNVFAANFTGLKQRKLNFQAAWDFNTQAEEALILENIEEGLLSFKKFFKKDSISVIAPSYTWTKKIETLLFGHGVRDMQGIMFQKEPIAGKQEYRRNWKFTQKTKNQTVGYQIRNVFFEPALYNHRNQVPDSLMRIEQAFRMKKPAIICTHRINFAGSLNESNRSLSINQLADLLGNVLKLWPETKFIGSSELSKIKND